MEINHHDTHIHYNTQNTILKTSSQMDLDPDVTGILRVIYRMHKPSMDTLRHWYVRQVWEWIRERSCQREKHKRLNDACLQSFE